MDFERRDLQTAAEPVAPTDLTLGSVYFMVHCLDDELTIPSLQPIVFIGTDLEPSDRGRFYFQDADSYLAGERYSDVTEPEDESPESSIVLHTFDASSIKAVFVFDKGLDVLIHCSIRRKELGLS